MDYNDRFRLTVKEFGREILIQMNRGTAVCSEDGKTVTITYDDGKTRKSSTKVKKENLDRNKPTG